MNRVAAGDSGPAMYEGEFPDGGLLRACDRRTELFGDDGHRLRYRGGTGPGR